MNVGKSLQIALIKADKDRAWLAEQMGVSVTRIGVLAKASVCKTDTLTRLAEAFGLSLDQFRELGEVVVDEGK